MQLALPNDLRVGDVAQPKRVLGEHQNEGAEATIKLAQTRFIIIDRFRIIPLSFTVTRRFDVFRA